MPFACPEYGGSTTYCFVCDIVYVVVVGVVFAPVLAVCNVRVGGLRIGIPELLLPLLGPLGLLNSSLSTNNVSSLALFAL